MLALGENRAQNRTQVSLSHWGGGGDKDVKMAQNIVQLKTVHLQNMLTTSKANAANEDEYSVLTTALCNDEDPLHKFELQHFMKNPSSRSASIHFGAQFRDSMNPSGRGE